MKKFITGRRGHRGIVVRIPHRPINQQRPTNHIFPWHEAPVAAIEALVAIIAEDEIISLRDNQLPVFDKLLHLEPPETLQPGHRHIQARELIAENIVYGGRVANIRLRQRGPVDEDPSFDEANAVSWNACDSLRAMWRRIYGLAENADVTSADLAIGHHPIADRTAPVSKLVDQEVVTD